MGFAPAAQVAGALLAIFGGPLNASESLRTRASLQVQEAAGVTVIKDPPLQLILSNGAGIWIISRPVMLTGMESYSAVTAEFVHIVEQFGFYRGITDSGELLSVSMGSERVEVRNEGSPSLHVMVAQFN